MGAWSRKGLKEKAKIRLKANYWKAVLVGLLAVLIGGGSSSASGVASGVQSSSTDVIGDSIVNRIPYISPAGTIMIILFALVVACIAIAIAIVLNVLLINPLEIGRNRFFYRDLEENAEIKEVCFTFDRGYKNGVKIMFFRDLYTILWSLLFIIPGIVKSYEYRMIPYILGENPDMNREQVFAMSKQMMDGNKWSLFCLDFSFIGWMILSGNKAVAKDYIEGLNMLSNMRLCSNVPGQSIVQTALGGHQSVEDYIMPGGRIYEQREFIYKALTDIPGISAVKPKAAFYIFPKIDTKKFNIVNDEQFVLDLLREKKVLLIHGGGFNWQQPDHFRVVYLPRIEVLKKATDSMADFLNHYRQ